MCGGCTESYSRKMSKYLMLYDVRSFGAVRRSTCLTCSPLRIGTRLLESEAPVECEVVHWNSNTW